MTAEQLIQRVTGFFGVQQMDNTAALIQPVAAYLKETTTRVPFSDWYQTDSGMYCYFIARSVQGGIFMPMLAEQIK